MVRRLILALLATASAATGAQAEWRKGETPHYIIYSEQPDDQIRDLGFRLELLDKTQRVLTRRKEALPAIKPVVYVLADEAAVQSTMAFGGSAGVAGFYNSTTRGPFMVTNRARGDGEFTPQLVMFHELTHYFMFENFPAAYPTWFAEGFAEFVGPTRVAPPNKMEVGRLSLNRYRTLADFEWLPVSRLVAAKRYGEVDNVLMLYAEGWLLTHYLTLGGTREGQLAKYLTAINQGKSFTDAAKEAFGDLNALNVELQAYARRRTLPTRTFEFRVPTTTETTLTPVSPARAALMTHDIKLMAGVGATDAVEFDTDVKRVAARFPQDPFALRLRCEAGLNAGDGADALAAAKQWIAIAPQDPLAMTFLGRAEIAGLKATASTDEQAWSAARTRIATAAKLRPKEPLILRAYHDSYLAQGKRPTDDAQNMLYDALDLNPNDDEVRYELAADFEARGLVSDAIALIRVAAFSSPEKDGENDKEKQKRLKLRTKYRMAGEEMHETPREMLTRLQAKAKAAGAVTAADNDQPS